MGRSGVAHITDVILDDPVQDKQKNSRFNSGGCRSSDKHREIRYSVKENRSSLGCLLQDTFKSRFLFHQQRNPGRQTGKKESRMAEPSASEPLPVNQQENWVGVDLGGTKILAAVFDDQFKLLGRERKKTKGFQGASQGMERLGDAVAKAMEEAEVDPNTIAGLGIGCPGPVDPDHGILIDGPNLGWENVPVKKILEDRFECPVYVTNDVDAGVYGEYRFGAAEQARCVLGVFPGTGVGGGCVYEGRIFRGHHVTAMEVGHMPMLAGGPLSSAGHSGSVEAMTSRLSIAAACAQAAYRGDAPLLRDEAGTTLSDIRSGMISESVKQKDGTVEQIVRQAAFQLGTVIAGLVHVLAPDKIVLGGGLVEALPKLYQEEVNDALKQWLMPAYAKVSEVVIAELGDDAAIMGAAAWAKHNVKTAN